MDEARDSLLRMIRDHEGNWGWYQFDRALAVNGIVGIHVPKAMLVLANDGLIACTGDVQLAATRYSLTDKGRALIELIEKNQPDRSSK